MSRNYGGPTSRYASGGSARAFSIPDADFHREATLKRRRQHSPPRAAAPARPSSAVMRARSKSKSRARVVARKQPGQEFIALGSNRAGGAATANTNKASYYRPPVAEVYQPPPASAAAARAQSRSPRARQSRWDAGAQPTTSGRRNPSPVSTRTRSKSSTREHNDVAAAIRRSERERSKSAARRTGGPPLASRAEPAASSRAGRAAVSQSRSGKKRERSKSVTRERERERGRERGRSPRRGRRSRRSKAAESSDEEKEKPARPSRSSRGSSRGSTLQEIEDAIADTERELAPKKTELDELRAQLETLQKRVELKNIEVFDLEVDLDALRKRRERRLPSHHSSSGRTEESSSRRSEQSARRSRSKSKSKRRESRRSSSQPRASKRPCIVDEDDEDSDDDDFRILDPSEVKKELESSVAGASTQPKTAVVPLEDSMPDNFWGRSPTPKLLANHRFRAIPDGSVRKGRHLAFNPSQPQIFATSPDEGGLILWSYDRKDQDILKVVTLTPNSFRKENPCAEAISWSPDGNRMAMAFRDPKKDLGEFCIVQLHQLKLGDSDTPEPIPRDRITSKRTTLHPRGISAIDWLPTGSGPATTSRQLVTTGSSDHAVVLWDEYENEEGALDLKFNVLHRNHRSEVRSLCVHSQRNCLYTGGLDGLLLRYDLNKDRASTVLERRKPSISKINSVLEHPHNPNLLMVSCVEQASHKLLLHDLRQPYDPSGMTLTWEGSAMSQYVVPRWSPAGYHVSCGSKTGVVNIWDVRMRGDHYPSVLPQQSLRVHRKLLVVPAHKGRRCANPFSVSLCADKTVLHATWHPRYDAMFSVSHDRTLGLLTFR
jgi:WD40 repeat protein